MKKEEIKKLNLNNLDDVKEINFNNSNDFCVLLAIEEESYKKMGIPKIDNICKGA